MYLAHHGILGQKWYVRRYQNPDGSLTPLGKLRYGSKQNYERAQYRSEAKKMLKDTRKTYKDYKALSEMTDADLKAAVIRLQQEKTYRGLVEDKIKYLENCAKKEPSKLSKFMKTGQSAILKGMSAELTKEAEDLGKNAVKRIIDYYTSSSDSKDDNSKSEKKSDAKTGTVEGVGDNSRKKEEKPKHDNTVVDADPITWDTPVMSTVLGLPAANGGWEYSM